MSSFIYWFDRVFPCEVWRFVLDMEQYQRDPPSAAKQRAELIPNIFVILSRELGWDWVAVWGSS